MTTQRRLKLTADAVLDGLIFKLENDGAARSLPASITP
jgi:hypothetical protein